MFNSSFLAADGVAGGTKYEMQRVGGRKREKRMKNQRNTKAFTQTFSPVLGVLNPQFYSKFRDFFYTLLMKVDQLSL